MSNRATVPSDEVRTHSVLVYSDNAATRERIELAVGRRPAPDLGVVEFVHANTHDGVMRAADKALAEVFILDGEAWPSGGMGICRQIKEEIRKKQPAVLLIIGRRDDAWLAKWSGAEAVVAHPIDPVEMADALSRLLRDRAGLPATAGS